MTEQNVAAIKKHVEDVMELHGVENFIILMDDTENNFFSMNGSFNNQSLLASISSLIAEFVDEG